MEEFERFRGIIRSERDKAFRWMSGSLDLVTRFMVPDEDEPRVRGHDGSLNTGLESLRRVVDGDLSTSMK